MIFVQKKTRFSPFLRKKTRKNEKNEKKRDPKKTEILMKKKTEIYVKNREIPTLFSKVQAFEFSKNEYISRLTQLF